MLVRLFLFLVFLGVAALAARRALRALRARPTAALRRLGPTELATLEAEAGVSEPIRRALVLRTQIEEAAAHHEDRANLGVRLDEAVRRVAEQQRLSTRIKSALEAGPASDLGDPERATRLERLAPQLAALAASTAGILSDLDALHLALLDLSAAQAMMAEGRLGEALEDLDGARAKTAAELEIQRLLSRA